MKVFYGPNTNPENKRLKDIKPWEQLLVGSLIVFVFWMGLAPNAFFKKMEPSIAAVRMMALNEAGRRPSYGETQMEVDENGNFVLTEARTADKLVPYKVISTAEPAKFHFETPEDPKIEAYASPSEH